MRRCWKLFESGALKPPRVETFPMSRAGESVPGRWRKRSYLFVGKLVLSAAEREAPVRVAAGAKRWAYERTGRIW